MRSLIHLYNAALAELGGEQIPTNISSLEEGTVGAICQNIFPHILDVVLESYEWRFAKKRTPLALLLSKSSVASIKDPVGMLEGRSEIDMKLLEIHQSQAKAYRLSEARAYTEAMRQELATAFFYGNVKGNPDGIHGLDPRYTFTGAPQVIDAGGTKDEACTSIWGVVWGENDTMGIFPKDSIAGLQHKEIPEHDVSDEEGHIYRAVGDLYQWNVGLSVRDWRSVVRIANIPVDKLMNAKGDNGFIDLHRLTIMGKNQVPAEKRMRMKWYMNSDVMTAMEMQASDAGNVTLVYRAEETKNASPLFKSYSVASLHGCDIRQCDAILSAEQALQSA